MSSLVKPHNWSFLRKQESRKIKEKTGFPLKNCGNDGNISNVLLLMNSLVYSPAPVHDTAPGEFSAYIPDPMTGVSPTLPGSIAGIPPVDAPAAISPCVSRATAPTVEKYCL